jgi:hypothetical protein
MQRLTVQNAVKPPGHSRCPSRLLKNQREVVGTLYAVTIVVLSRANQRLIEGLGGKFGTFFGFLPSFLPYYAA